MNKALFKESVKVVTSHCNPVTVSWSTSRHFRSHRFTKFGSLLVSWKRN